ncbi:hypothetical protein GGS20DRAFT_155087 [Poronia punctata]|nr:hypothetical protein GGS20DRAFT_155087 [Poronia punctata]
MITHGVKRKAPGSSSQPLQREISGSPKPPHPPPDPMRPPDTASGLHGSAQESETGETDYMTYAYQKGVPSSFDLQIKEHEARIRSLEDAEDSAIGAMRQVRDEVLPRLDALAPTVYSHNNAIEELSNHLAVSLGNSSGDITDYIREIASQMVMPLTRSFTGMAETIKQLQEENIKIKTMIGSHEEKLTEQGQQLVYAEAKLVEIQRKSLPTRVKDVEESVVDHGIRLGQHAERLTGQNRLLESLQDTVDILDGSVSAIRRSPGPQVNQADIAAIFKLHQHRLEYLERTAMERTFQHQIGHAQKEQLPNPISPPSRSLLGNKDIEPSVATTLEAPTESRIEILRRADFQNPEDLASLQELEEELLHEPLYSESDECENACYTVQRGGVDMWSWLRCYRRKAPKLMSRFWQREEWLNYPAIIELKPRGHGPTGKTLPRYVYEIGEVFSRKVVPEDRGGQMTQRSTGYHLVVDVTRAEKSLWLVYRYEELDDDDKSLKQTITYVRDTFWHPFASVGEFDIAMIFERFEDWKGSDTPVGAFTKSKILVRDTGCVVQPRFIEPVLAKLKVEIQRGWNPTGKRQGGNATPTTQERAIANRVSEGERGDDVENTARPSIGPNVMSDI